MRGVAVAPDVAARTAAAFAADLGNMGLLRQAIYNRAARSKSACRSSRKQCSTSDDAFGQDVTGLTLVASQHCCLRPPTRRVGL